MSSMRVVVGVSKLGRTHLIFVDPGVTVNGDYYRCVSSTTVSTLHTSDIRPSLHFRQDSAPAQRARQTVNFLERETYAFITPDLWPANSPDLNPVSYKIWGIIQQRVYPVL